MEDSKAPFSLSDFLGYVFPGAFLCIVIYCVFEINPIYHIDWKTIMNVIVDIPKKMGDGNVWVFTMIALVLTYIVGHVVAYLSSITIERYLVWFYGYPSRFLLEDTRNIFWSDWRDINRNRNKNWWLNIIRTYLIRLIIILLLFPIFLIDFFVRVLGMRAFLSKPLDAFLVDSIKNKKNALLINLNLSEINGNEHADDHRLIYHYEYEKVCNHRSKMDNYVAIYDFLRSIALILNALTMFVLICVLYNRTFTCDFFGLLALLELMTYLMFMGFFKFYRRFTLESFMCLVADKSLMENE